MSQPAPPDPVRIVCVVEGGILREVYADVPLVYDTVDLDDDAVDERFHVTRQDKDGALKDVPEESRAALLAAELPDPFGPYDHLSRHQREKVRAKAVDQLVADLREGAGFIRPVAEKYVDRMTLPEQLNQIDPDPWAVSQVLGFDPDAGRAGR